MTPIVLLFSWVFLLSTLPDSTDEVDFPMTSVYSDTGCTETEVVVVKEYDFRRGSHNWFQLATTLRHKGQCCYDIESDTSYRFRGCDDYSCLVRRYDGTTGCSGVGNWDDIHDRDVGENQCHDDASTSSSRYMHAHCMNNHWDYCTRAVPLAPIPENFVRVAFWDAGSEICNQEDLMTIFVDAYFMPGHCVELASLGIPELQMGSMLVMEIQPTQDDAIDVTVSVWSGSGCGSVDAANWTYSVTQFDVCVVPNLASSVITGPIMVVSPETGSSTALAVGLGVSIPLLCIIAVVVLGVVAVIIVVTVRKRKRSAYRGKLRRVEKQEERPHTAVHLADRLISEEEEEPPSPLNVQSVEPDPKPVVVSPPALNPAYDGGIMQQQHQQLKVPSAPSALSGEVDAPDYF